MVKLDSMKIPKMLDGTVITLAARSWLIIGVKAKKKVFNSVLSKMVLSLPNAQELTTTLPTFVVANWSSIVMLLVMRPKPMAVWLRVRLVAS